MFAVVLIRRFSLQSVLRTERFPAKTPVAVLRESAQRSVIYQSNSFAESYGVRPGQTISQAIAKCKELQVHPRKPIAEQSARKTIFVCLYGVTPLIEETSEEHYTLKLSGIHASERKDKITQLRQSLRKLGFAPQIGVATSYDWAYYAAQSTQNIFWVEDSEKFFSEVSVNVAVTDETLRNILYQWGIHTLGQLAEIPRHAITKRLGKEGLDLWQSLHRPQPRMLTIKSPPKTYDAEIELEYTLQTLEPLLFILNRLLEQLCLQLKGAFLYAKILILELGLEDQTQYRRVFKLPEPTTQKDKLQQLLDTHLEQYEADSPIVKVRVQAIPTESKPPQSQLFHHQVQDPWKLSSTLHQLVGLVGSENVGSPVRKDDHQPDSFSMEALTQVLSKPEDNSVPSTRATGALRLQRFRPPVSAKVKIQNGSIHQIHFANNTHNILSSRGPWHQSGNWWNQRRWNRMEWDVELESGSLYRISYTHKKWWIEGAYG